MPSVVVSGKLRSNRLPFPPLFYIIILLLPRRFGYGCDACCRRRTLAGVFDFVDLHRNDGRDCRFCFQTRHFAQQFLPQRSRNGRLDVGVFVRDNLFFRRHFCRVCRTVRYVDGTCFFLDRLRKRRDRQLPCLDRPCPPYQSHDPRPQYQNHARVL